MASEYDDYIREEPAEQSPENRFGHFQDYPYSGLGIASFVISLVAGIAGFGLIVAAGIIAGPNPKAVDEKSPIIIAIGCSVILVILCALIGLCLGIAGLVQRNRKKVFAILGACFNAMLLLGLIGLVIVGLAFG